MLAVGVCNLPETYFLLIFLGVYEVGCFWKEGRINQLRDCTLKVPHKVFSLIQGSLQHLPKYRPHPSEKASVIV